MWLKPDVLERLDSYCLFYGVGRGRAIGHLLQGALPDPSWLPQRPTFLEDPSESSEAFAAASSGPMPEADPLLTSAAERPKPLFQAGDRISNNSGDRHGVIASEPCQWVEPVQLPSGEHRPGHWTYAVAWDGQMGLTTVTPRTCYAHGGRSGRPVNASGHWPWFWLRDEKAGWQNEQWPGCCFCSFR